MSPRVILITGATAGIGRHAALGLARRGHHVIATGRKADALAALKAEAGGVRLDVVTLDVNDPASIQAAYTEVQRLTAGRGVDALINNAGYGQMGAVLDVADDAVHAQFDTNVHGLLRVTRAFAPDMIRRGSGRILNVSSVGGRMVFPMAGVYHATKYAVEALSDALRLELAPHGVQVVVIEPGAIRTRFGETAVASLGHAAPASSPWGPAYAITDAVMSRYESLAPDPTAVTHAMATAIESARPRARYVAPWYNTLMIAVATRLPTWLFDLVLRAPFGLTASRLRRPALPGPGAA
ncbi:MAG TPA: SDR family oxidoreductase [Myxococcota bacterium]|nr:SDR family oxidoreductase [Myxococcota bacterium]